MQSSLHRRKSSVDRPSFRSHINETDRIGRSLKTFYMLDGTSDADRKNADTKPPTSPYNRWGKRIFDFAGAGLLLLLALPVILVLLFLVAKDGGNPIFAHRRVGKGGQSFPCFKIRTMVVDGEARLKELLGKDPAAAAEWEATFKLLDDPRITRTGKFIRATSLDELPQLWNVLRGEMSLVGPRPVTEAEIPLYGKDAEAYRSVSPGMTGVWQVSGRNSLSFAERVELDRAYTQNLSLLGDLRILFQTVPAVLKRTGL